MARRYEYWITKDDEDFVVSLEVVSISSSKGTFSSQASDPDEYYGIQEIEWKTAEDTAFMSDAQIASMEEWLFNEHSEYLADLDCFD